MRAVRLADDVQTKLLERREQLGGHIRLGREVRQRGRGPIPNGAVVPSLSREARPTTRSARCTSTRRTSASSW